MYNLQLTSEQIEIRDMVRDFVAKELKPASIKPARMEALDRSPLWPQIDQASQMGLRALRLSEDLGGAGADALTAAIVSEELAVGDPDAAAILAETSAVARVLFGKAMNKAQRDKYLPAFSSDDRYHLAHAAAAPDTELGIPYYNPAAAPKAAITAKAAGSDFVLNGSAAVANAPIAKLIAVEAQVDGAKGVSTFIVPAGTKGLSVRQLPAGRYVGSMGEVTLKDCRIPADQLLGKGGEGVMLNGSTLARQSVNLGIGRAAYEAAVEYAGLRVQGAKHIIQHQAIGTKLAESLIRLEVARNAIWKACWVSEHPEALSDGSISPDLPLEAISHVFVAEQIHRATKDCAECFGAMGVMRDMPLWKYIADARMLLHAGAGVADAKLAIAEAIAGYRRDGA